ncbi:MAG: hypothetical protein IKR48_06475 [Kiritimatiellae bacterium]|nr:hypothetical protein [Kiritimatiellia bacterium]
MKCRLAAERTGETGPPPLSIPPSPSSPLLSLHEAPSLGGIIHHTASPEGAKVHRRGQA